MEKVQAIELAARALLTDIESMRAAGSGTHGFGPFSEWERCDGSESVSIVWPNLAISAEALIAVLKSAGMKT